METKEGISLKYAHNYVMKLLKVAETHGGLLAGQYVTIVMPRILAYDFSRVRFPTPSFIFPDEKLIESFMADASFL